VSLAGVTDLERAFELKLSGGVVESLLGGTPAQVPERYKLASPMALLPLGVKQVLVHGTEDSIVPYSLSQGYSERAHTLKDPVRLVGLKGAEHFDVIDPKGKEWPRIVEAVASLL
jgi:pimeloyl-ACP methyl ester carboxylesterase